MANKKECPYRKELDFSLWCKRTCRYCTLEQHETCKVKKEAINITNADRIRRMTDEELAKVIMCPYERDYRDCQEGCWECCFKWLKLEVGCE